MYYRLAIDLYFIQYNRDGDLFTNTNTGNRYL